MFSALLQIGCGAEAAAIAARRLIRMARSSQVQICTISFILPTLVARKPTRFPRCRFCTGLSFPSSATNPRTVLAFAHASGRRRPSNSSHSKRRLCGLRKSISTLPLFGNPLAVDLSRDSAHKACIAILAEEYHRESRHSRGALRRSKSSRELLGLLSNVIETLGPSRPASASRTPLNPSSSPEP
jgi:hypothetical protein